MQGIDHRGAHWIGALDRQLQAIHQLAELANNAGNGLARAIRPIHTPFDGDTVFAMGTGRLPLTNPAMLARLGHLAADTLARAVARGVYHAASLGDRPGWRERFGH